LADVEIIARVERRRKWTAEEKAALLAEVEAEGGKVMVVARRHRISESVLYNWRAALKAAAVGPAPVAAPFIPLGVFGGSSHRDTAMLAQLQPPEPGSPRPSGGGNGGVGGIEIVLPNGARVSVDAFVNEKALSRVLRAMKGAT
jgi:transposase